MDGLLVHRATGVAIACANVSVGVELLTADGTDENQIVSFSEAEEFKVIVTGWYWLLRREFISCN